MERISALMDGELEQADAARVLPDLKQREEFREAWSTYHLIGDALRGVGCQDCGVARGVASKLVSEPTVIAPRRPKPGFMMRWALPGMAVAAAMSAVTWIGLQQLSIPGNNGFQPVSTATDMRAGSVNNAVFSVSDLMPAPTAGAPTAQIQLTSQAYQPYLQAHQPFSPSVAIQGLAPYMRTVGAEADR